jgi:hypothetical protein
MRKKEKLMNYSSSGILSWSATTKPVPSGIHTLLYLERLVKAAKSRARAAMNNAKSISIGPLVVADRPKTKTTMMSNIPKMAHATISGRGCFVQFIRLFFLSSGV